MKQPRMSYKISGYKARVKQDAKNMNPISKRELQLFIENDSELYHQREVPIQKNLEKKMKKGVYDSEKAEKLYYYEVDAGAKKYQKEFGGNFSTADKRSVARSLKRNFEHEAKSGNFQV